MSARRSRRPTEETRDSRRHKPRHRDDGPNAVIGPRYRRCHPLSNAGRRQAVADCHTADVKNLGTATAALSPLVVLAEIVWVLVYLYSVDRAGVAEVGSELLTTEQFRVESVVLVLLNPSDPSDFCSGPAPAMQTRYGGVVVEYPRDS